MNDLIDWETTALSVARNQVGPRLPAEELMVQLGLTESEFNLLVTDELFRRKVREFAKELTENGTSFVLKAKVQAEELLKTNFKIARGADTPPSVAVAAIANVVRWAKYDQRPSGDGTDPMDRPRISVNINLGAATQPTTTTIDVTPTPAANQALPDGA